MSRLKTNSLVKRCGQRLLTMWLNGAIERWIWRFTLGVAFLGWIDCGIYAAVKTLDGGDILGVNTVGSMLFVMCGIILTGVRFDFRPIVVAVGVIIAVQLTLPLALRSLHVHQRPSAETMQK